MRKIPILYVGAPGIGKTEMVRQKYDHCEVLLLSSQNEEDIAGLPYREGEKERRTIPPYIERIVEAHKLGKKTCLFLDEIDKARREVADTLLTLVTHPEHFGLPSETDIVAAANPPEWGGGDGLSKPMASRFAIIEMKTDTEKWVSYMREKYTGKDIAQKIISLFENGEIPLLELTENENQFNFRLSCPRTIEMAIRAISNGEEFIEEKINGLLTPNVGSAILTMFRKNEGFNVPFEQTQEVSRKIGAKVLKKIYRI
jgi:hypothetical protein